MTTIATDGKTMCSDGARFRNDVKVALRGQKVVRLNDGSLLGCSGDTIDCEAFRNWMNSGGQVPHLESMYALHLTKDGLLTYYSEKCIGVSAESPAALGSGCDLALGAMLAGASPREAVAISISRDAYSGGEIVELGFND